MQWCRISFFLFGQPIDDSEFDIPSVDYEPTLESILNGVYGDSLSEEDPFQNYGDGAGVAHQISDIPVQQLVCVELCFRLILRFARWICGSNSDFLKYRGISQMAVIQFQSFLKLAQIIEAGVRVEVSDRKLRITKYRNPTQYSGMWFSKAWRRKLFLPL